LPATPAWLEAPDFLPEAEADAAALEADAVEILAEPPEAFAADEMVTA